MRILFVIDTFYTSNNGTSISAQRYAAELRKRGRVFRNEKVCDRSACLLHLRKMRAEVLLYDGPEQKSQGGQGIKPEQMPGFQRPAEQKSR